MNAKISNTDDPNSKAAEIVIEMIIFDALLHIHKLTGYNKDKVLLTLIKIAKLWLVENLRFN